MLLEKYVGKTVLLNVTAEFGRENESLFQSAPSARLLYVRVVAHDEIGLWVENPSWRARPARGGEPMSHVAHVLVPWAALVSVAVFPNRQFPSDEPILEKEARSIGFGDH